MLSYDQAVMKWLGGNIWPDDRRRSRCGHKYTCTSKPPSIPYYECDKRFSVKLGTVMKHSKIGYQTGP